MAAVDGAVQAAVAAVATLGREPGRSVRLVDLALSVGYSDQAHMARECRSPTCLAASALLARPGGTLALSDLFKMDDHGLL